MTISDDFWVQHFFEGIFFKFTAGSTISKGEALNEEEDQLNKKRDYSVISLTDCHILSISIRQFEFLLKSIERAKTNKIV